MTEQEQEHTKEFSELFPLDESTKGWLYRISEHNQKIQVCRFDGFIPDAHDIGLQYGSGKYCLMIAYKDGETKKQTTKNFILGKNYDAQQPQQQQHTNGGELSEVVKIMMVMLDKMNQQQQNPILPNLGGLMEDVFKKATNVLEDNLKRQQTAINGFLYQAKKESVQRTQAQPQQAQPQQQQYYYDDEEEEEEAEDMAGMLVKMGFGFVKAQIPALIAGTVPQETIQMLKNNPLYTQIVNNPQAKREFEMLILENFDFDTLGAVKQILSL